jgi:glucoamylase
MRQHLYSPSLKRFIRALMPDDNGGFYSDASLDSSLFGIFYFGVFDANDEVVTNTMQALENRLWVKSATGGVARYENDGYMTVSPDFANIAGNPWFISTLWLADYYIASAQTREDLGKAMCILEWVTLRALPSGVLAEQVNPLDGSPASVSPLTWSHSSFVATVMSYLIKLSEFETNYFPYRQMKR